APWARSATSTWRSRVPVRRRPPSRRRCSGSRPETPSRVRHLGPGGPELPDGAREASDAAGGVVAVQEALADRLVECACGAPQGFLRGGQVLADDGLTDGAHGV